MSDFRVRNEGSLVLLEPLSNNAFAWVAAHLPDNVQYFGNSIAVEPRYISDILVGIQNDGLEIKQ